MEMKMESERENGKSIQSVNIKGSDVRLQRVL